MPKSAIFEGSTLTMLAQNCKKTGNDANKLRTLSDASNKSVFPFQNLDSHLQDFFSKFCSKIGKNDDCFGNFWNNSYSHVKNFFSF